MKTRSTLLNQLLRIAGLAAVATVGVLSILGSGGDSDDDVQLVSVDASAFNFTATNTLTAAQLAAATMIFFPAFSDVGQAIHTVMETGDPNNSPFDLGICTNAGTSSLSWNDLDSSTDLSVGDTAALQLVSCDLDNSGELVTGSIDFSVSSLDGDPLPNSVGFSVTVDIDISDLPDSTNFSAGFLVTSSTTDNINFTYTYVANDAPGQELVVTENGSRLYQFACFNVVHSFNIGAGAGTYNLAPTGVINVADTIMSFAGGPAASFINNSMESGTRRLLSLAVPACANAGTENGVNDSDGSYIDMEALGGGAIRLHTFDITNTEFYTVDTTWTALLD